jgi:hypothetical protein
MPEQNVEHAPLEILHCRHDTVHAVADSADNPVIVAVVASPPNERARSRDLLRS